MQRKEMEKYEQRETKAVFLSGDMIIHLEKESVGKNSKINFVN